jgi:hypothetical protein
MRRAPSPRSQELHFRSGVGSNIALAVLLLLPGGLGLFVATYFLITRFNGVPFPANMTYVLVPIIGGLMIWGGIVGLFGRTGLIIDLDRRQVRRWKTVLTWRKDQVTPLGDVASVSLTAMPLGKRTVHSVWLTGPRTHINVSSYENDAPAARKDALDVTAALHLPLIERDFQRLAG